MSRAPRVAVIGGGMAGLAAAYRLQTETVAGDAAPGAPADGAAPVAPADGAIDWVLYERADYLGGKVRSERTDDGFVVEGGPDSFIIEKPWPIELARKVGVYDRLLDSNEDVRRSWVYSRGRLHELPEGLILMVPTRLVPFALSSLVSWPGKLRMGMDLVLPRGKDVGDESLGDFVRRRLGREALEKVAEPMVAGVHAGDPEQMSLRTTFPMFHQMEEKYRSLILGMVQRRRARGKAATGAAGGGSAESGSAGGAQRRPRSYFLSFETGLSDLSDAVVASLPRERLRTGVGVERIAAGAAGPKAGASASAPAAPPYTLTLSDGTTDEVDALVLATPAFAAGELLRTLAPAAADDLESIPYVSTATVSFAFRRDDLASPPSGFGFVVPRVEERGIMACTFSSSKFAHRAPDDHVLVRAFVGRAGREEALTLDDGELAALARRELAVMAGISAEPVFHRIFRWPRGMPQYRVGHKGLIDAVEAAVAACPGVEIAGGYLHGIGIGDCIREGTAAAERALSHVVGRREPAVPPQPDDVPAADGVED